MAVDLDPIFYPKSIALIGASSQRKWGSIMLNNVLVGGYQGKVYPVNPKMDSIFGLKVYPEIKNIPDEVDLGIVAIPAAKVPGVLEDFEGKAKAALVISAGFGETKEGGELEKEIVKIARRAGIPLVGPNTMGVFNSEIRLSALMPQIDPKEGVISFVSQSGNLGTQVVQTGIEEGIGFRKFVSSGNEADVTCSDYIEYLGQDPKTKIILAYIEGLKEGRKFFEVAKRVTKEKPIVVYKAGSTQAGSRAARSHTGAIAGSDKIYDAMFEQAGVIRARNTEELLELGSAFAGQPLPKGRKIGILTAGGGWGVVVADACSKMGLEVPNLPDPAREEISQLLPPYWSKNNPVDMVAFADPVAHYKCLRILAGCGEFDGIIFMGGLAMKAPKMVREIKDEIDTYPMESLIEEREMKLAHKLVELVHEYNKPIIPVNLTATLMFKKSMKFLREKGIDVYTTPEKAARVLACLAKYREKIVKRFI